VCALLDATELLKRYLLSSSDMLCCGGKFLAFTSPSPQSLKSEI